jgi:hypothetical protein
MWISTVEAVIRGSDERSRRLQTDILASIEDTASSGGSDDDASDAPFHWSLPADAVAVLGFLGTKSDASHEVSRYLLTLLMDATGDPVCIFIVK